MARVCSGAHRGFVATGHKIVQATRRTQLFPMTDTRAAGAPWSGRGARSATGPTRQRGATRSHDQLPRLMWPTTGQQESEYMIRSDEVFTIGSRKSECVTHGDGVFRSE